MGDFFGMDGWSVQVADGGIVPVEDFPTETISIDAPEFEDVTSLREAKECTLTFQVTRKSSRQLRKQVMSGLNHMKRVHRHERRLRERIRRARLKGKKWVCIRDKDGGQICISTSKRMEEHGWLTIRQKRKIIWDGEKRT